MPWAEVPAALRRVVEEHLGARVTEAVTQAGGFSPGVAARLRLVDGRRVFVKAVGPEPNPRSPGIHRAEARIAAALHESTPAPRLLGSFELDGWVLLVLEDIEGSMPRLPWDPAELTRVLGSVGELSTELTPSPIDAPSVAERFGDAFHGWRRLLYEDQAGLDPWAQRNLAELAALEAGWADAAAGSTLAHADLRADNILLTEDRVYIVDWPWACQAAPWFDLLAMLPSVRMQGGPPPETLFDNHPVTRDADPAAVTATLAALTGFFTRESRRPPPPGLPTLRPFQAAHVKPALTWLRTRFPTP